MPIYEYRCEPCHKPFEAFLASSSEQAVCPHCSGTQLTRLMSTFAASVPGGYKATQLGGGAGSGATEAPAAPKAGGCGGGCACH